MLDSLVTNMSMSIEYGRTHDIAIVLVLNKKKLKYLYTVIPFH